MGLQDGKECMDGSIHKEELECWDTHFGRTSVSHHSPQGIHRNGGMETENVKRKQDWKAKGNDRVMHRVKDIKQIRRKYW